MTTFLYRLWDADDELLYIGISKSAIHRLHRHLVDQPWSAQIVKQTIERFDCRREALTAEKLAIKSEYPKYNITHSLTNNQELTTWNFLVTKSPSEMNLQEGLRVALRLDRRDPVYASQFSRSPVYGLCGLIGAIKPGHFILKKCGICHEWETPEFFRIGHEQWNEAAVVTPFYLSSETHQQVKSLVSQWQRVAARRCAA